MRYTIDFKDKKGGGHIEASDLAGYVTLLDPTSVTLLNQTSRIPILGLDFESVAQTQALFKNSKETGVKHERVNPSDPGSTIVLKNGTLDVQEAKKLLNGVKASFDIEFINCSGTLDLNKDLKKYADSIRFQDCKFETASDCFKGAKVLQFFGTTLEPLNGQLGFDEDAEVGADNGSFVLPQNMWIMNAIVWEKAKNRSQNKTTTNFETEKTAHMENIKEQLSSLQTQYNRLNKELEEIKRKNKEDSAQYKLEVTELKEKAKEKDRVIGALGKEIEKLEKERKREKDNFVEIMTSKGNKESNLFSLCEMLQTQLKGAIGTNKMYETNIKNMKDINMKLKKENESLIRNQGSTKERIDGLKASNLKLEAIKGKLEAENNALKEEIWKSSETVRWAQEAVKRNKKLTKENEELRDAKEKANSTVKKLNKDIETLTKRCEIATKWANDNVSLIGDMRKLRTIDNVKVFLNEAGYWKKQRETKKKLEENEDSKNLKTKKKGKWLEFDPILFIKPNESKEEEEEEEEEEEKEGSKEKSKDCFGIKTDGIKEDYFEEEDFQDDYSRRFGWNKRGRGNRGNYRGRYRNNFRRGRGEMMVHRPRGRGRPQYDNYYRK